MISSLKKLFLASLVAVVASTGAISVFAADQPAPVDAPPKVKKAKGMPFNGKIKSVDKAAKTITLNREKSNLLQITSQTKITKDGKPAVFDDIVAGETVGGVAHEKDGKLEVSSLRVGPKPGAESKQKKEKKKDPTPEAK